MFYPTTNLTKQAKLHQNQKVWIKETISIKLFATVTKCVTAQAMMILII